MAGIVEADVGCGFQKAGIGDGEGRIRKLAKARIGAWVGTWWRVDYSERVIARWQSAQVNLIS